MSLTGTTLSLPLRRVFLAFLILNLERIHTVKIWDVVRCNQALRWTQASSRKYIVIWIYKWTRFFYGLSNDTASSLFYTASNDWMIVNNGLESWKQSGRGCQDSKWLSHEFNPQASSCEPMWFGVLVNNWWKIAFTGVQVAWRHLYNLNHVSITKANPKAVRSTSNALNPPVQTLMHHLNRACISCMLSSIKFFKKFGVRTCCAPCFFHFNSVLIFLC